MASFSAFPLRTKIADLLAELAEGLLAEEIYRTHCSMSYPRHIATSYTKAILVIGVLGILAEIWWARQRVRSFAAR